MKVSSTNSPRFGASSRAAGSDPPSDTLTGLAWTGIRGTACRAERVTRRSVAQPGSAPHWGCGGRRFKSSRSDHFLLRYESFRFASPRRSVRIHESARRLLPPGEQLFLHGPDAFPDGLVAGRPRRLFRGQDDIRRAVARLGNQSIVTFVSGRNPQDRVERVRRAGVPAVLAAM